MKLRNIIFLNLFSIIVCNGAMIETDMNKKLVLHIDVNKTIISMDIVQGKDLKETVNMILAENTVFSWDGVNQQSYFDYLTSHIAEENPGLSRASDEFKDIRNKLLKEFPSHLNAEYSELFESYKKEWLKMMTILGIKEEDITDLNDSILDEEKRFSTSNLVIFPSFFELISWLKDNFNGRYSIVLRTFGTDLPTVMPLINKISGIEFSEMGKFQKMELTIGRDLVSYTDFFRSLNSRNYAIRDDYNFWKSNGFQAEGGKLFVFDSTDTDTVTMFFDDNADDLDRPIIHPVGPDGTTLLNTKELLDLNVIVAVNPKDAILDNKYFIKKVLDRLQK